MPKAVFMKKYIWPSILCLICSFASFPCSAVEPDPENPHGIIFTHFKKIDKKIPEGRLLVYQLNATNLPPNQEFTLVYDNLLCWQKLVDLKVNSEGKLVSSSAIGDQAEAPLESMFFIQHKYFIGQPAIYTLISKDNTMKVRTMFVPFPNEVVATDGAKMSLTLLSSEARDFLLELTGFKPSEACTFISQSCHEVCSYPYAMTENGRGLIHISPGVVGKKGGKARAEIIREDSSRIVLHYEWGVDAIQEEKLIQNDSGEKTKATDTVAPPSKNQVAASYKGAI